MRQPSSEIAAEQSNNRSCKRCGGELELSQKSGPGRPPVYCEQCRRRRQRKQIKRALQCRFCEQEFRYVQRGRRAVPAFCSPRCRGRAREADRPRLMKSCTQCCTEFFTTNNCRRCCSAACGVKARDAIRATKARAHRRRTCKICGGVFVMRHHLSGKALRGEVREGMFCSRECLALHRRVIARGRCAIGDLFDCNAKRRDE